MSGGCATLCMSGLVSQIHFLHKLENKLTSRSRASHLTTREVDVLSLSHLKKRKKIKELFRVANLSDVSVPRLLVNPGRKAPRNSVLRMCTK